MYSCPSGKRPTTWCAHCTASAVLPTPAVPQIAEIATVPAGARSPRSSIAFSVSSSRARPMNAPTAGGSCRGTADPESVPTSAGMARCSGMVRPSTAPSRAAEPRRGWVTPRSMSLIARTLSPDIWASCSWVRPTATRRDRIAPSGPLSRHGSRSPVLLQLASIFHPRRSSPYRNNPILATGRAGTQCGERTATVSSHKGSRRTSQRGLPPRWPAVWRTRPNPCASKS